MVPTLIDWRTTTTISFDAYGPFGGEQMNYASGLINSPFTIIGVMIWTAQNAPLYTWAELYISSDTDSGGGKKPNGTRILPANIPIALSDDVLKKPDPIHPVQSPMFLPLEIDVPERNRSLKVWVRNTHATVDQEVYVLVFIRPFSLPEAVLA